MPRILFWNTGRCRLDQILRSLVMDTQPDVFVLIEPATSAGLPRGLAAAGYTRINGSDRFLIASLRSTSLSRMPYPDPRARIEFWRADVAGQDGWLFVVVHGPDRWNEPQDDSRELLFRQAVTHAGQLERQLGHRRTVIFGDLNANPYDPSVMGANGFHAIGVRKVRGQNSRTIRNAGKADFFYNPTCRLYGSDPSGDSARATYFHRQGYSASEPFWHLLDQVLIRSEVAHRLPPDELRILATAGSISLLTPDGIPDHETASDHLPVVFSVV